MAQLNWPPALYSHDGQKEYKRHSIYIEIYTIRHAVSQLLWARRLDNQLTYDQINYIGISSICSNDFSVGQKFMVKDNDTLPYKLEMEIRDGDTTYFGACRTFEKINGQIVNQSDDQCLRQGLWIIIDSVGNYWTGNYHDNNEVGNWKQKTENFLKRQKKFHSARILTRLKQLITQADNQ